MNALPPILLGITALAGLGGGAWWLGLFNFLGGLNEQRRKGREEDLARAKENRERQDMIVNEMETLLHEVKEAKQTNEQRMEAETRALRERVKILEHDRDVLQARVSEQDIEIAHLKAELYDLHHPRIRPKASGGTP